MSTTFVPPKPDQWEGPSQKFTPPPVDSWQGPAKASVPGMELLGGTPPPAANPPNALRPSISMTNRDGQITDAGANVPMGAAATIATSPLRAGKALLESSGKNVSTGVKRINNSINTRKHGDTGPGLSWNPLKSGDPLGNYDLTPTSEELGGTSDTARGVGEAALPIAAATNPVGLAEGMAVGVPTSMAVEGTANALGVPQGTSQFLGDAAGFGVGAKAPELASDLASRTKNFVGDAFAREPQTSMVKAMKPTSTNTGFKASLDRSLPELKATEADTGKPIESLSDLMNAIETAKKRVWEQYRNIAEQPAVDPYSGKPTVGTMADAQHDMTPVADAMESTISPKLLRENPVAVKSIKALAAKYRTSMTLQEAESILKSTNAELDGYYAKYPAGQRTALAANPQVAVKEAQASALRDTIYNALDAAGEGAAPREFKQRYGALMNLEREGYRRMNVADRQQPDSLSEQVGKWSGVGKVVKGVLTMNPADVAMGVAESKTAKWLKEQQTTDALIKSAMSRFKGAPAPVESPAPFQPKALIGKGDIITPKPVDTSYVRSAPAMTQPPNPRRALPPPSTTVLPMPGDVQPSGPFNPQNIGAGAPPQQIPPPVDWMNARKMARGGIVRKPTLAVVGEAGPEAIVPLGAPPRVHMPNPEPAPATPPPAFKLRPMHQRSAKQRGAIFEAMHHHQGGIPPRVSIR